MRFLFNLEFPSWGKDGFIDDLDYANDTYYKRLT